MSTLFYAVKKDSHPEQPVLIGQSSYRSRFLFGPTFCEGIISFRKFMRENQDYIIIDEYKNFYSFSDMLMFIVNTCEFDHNSDNLKRFFLTPDGFLFSPHAFE